MPNENAPLIRTELQVMFFDTDCAAVVHNIAYLRFIEVARTLLAEELGLGLAQMAETQRYPVVVRTEIDYRRAAKLGDRLVVEGRLDRLERVRVEDVRTAEQRALDVRHLFVMTGADPNSEATMAPLVLIINTAPPVSDATTRSPAKGPQFEVAMSIPSARPVPTFTRKVAVPLESTV